MKTSALLLNLSKEFEALEILSEELESRRAAVALKLAQAGIPEDLPEVLLQNEGAASPSAKVKAPAGKPSVERMYEALAGGPLYRRDLLEKAGISTNAKMSDYTGKAAFPIRKLDDGRYARADYVLAPGDGIALRRAPHKRKEARRRFLQNNLFSLCSEYLTKRPGETVAVDAVAKALGARPRSVANTLNSWANLGRDLKRGAERYTYIFTPPAGQ